MVISIIVIDDITRPRCGILTARYYYPAGKCHAEVFQDDYSMTFPIIVLRYNYLLTLRGRPRHEETSARNSSWDDQREQGKTTSCIALR